MKVEITGVILGGLISIITTLVFNCFQSKKLEEHNSKLLYYDILSIMKYFCMNYDWENSKEYPGIRYNSDWQNLLVHLKFLASDKIVIIYNLYDTVFDYNSVLEQTREWEKCEKYWNEAAKIVYDVKLKQLMDELKRKAKIR